MLSKWVVFDGWVLGKYSAYLNEEGFDLMEIIRCLYRQNIMVQGKLP